MFVDSPELGSERDRMSPKVLDSDPEALKTRKPLRRALLEITRPILEEKITPFVHLQYPEVCTRGSGRNCTPCYSLIRRYRHDERQSHATHYDGHALVTVMVSLSDYDREYRGGLYLSTGYGQREFLGLSRGDAAVHQSTLLHGVQVYPLEDRPEETVRWSWILWYRDSETCQEDHSHEWFAGCAREGNPLCQSLHATKVGNVPGITPDQAQHQIAELNLKAALGGVGTSAIKVARAYLKMLPSHLPYSEEEARKYYQIAIDSNSPDGHYGMAHMLLVELRARDQGGGRTTTEQDGVDRKRWRDDRLRLVVDHLEKAALMGHHAYSMFNLGMVHTYGYGIPDDRIDAELAAEWFVASGLPEGYMVAAHQAASVGDARRQQEYAELAMKLGFAAPWRRQARDATGSGGAGGVDLNLPWPRAADGRTPPIV